MAPCKNAGRPGAWVAALGAFLLPALGAFPAPPAMAQAAHPGAETAPETSPVRAALLPSAETQLGLIEHFYQGDAPFRAESEALRFLFAFPDDPRRPEVELLRAKLYYREGRYAESRLMLISLLDRHPGAPARTEAERLLGFSLVRDGLLDDAEPYLSPAPGLPDARGGRAGLEALRVEPEGFVSPDAAQAWSTWLPGTGFFLVSQPGKAWAALSLNLFFTGATVAAAKNELYGTALILLLVESALYRGGREAARTAAENHNAALRATRTEDWLRERGEPDLLAAGLTLSLRFR